MIICDRCGKPGARRGYLRTEMASGSLRAESYHEIEADLCNKCQDAFAVFVRLFPQPLPKEA